MFTNKKIILVLISLLLFVFSTACENSASHDDDHSGHSDPFGVALIMNGVEIAKQENGEITYHEGDHLELKSGEETNIINVRWIAEDGDRFLPEEGQGYSLSWEISDEDILEVVHHDEDGPWAFHLAGKNPGETTISFRQMHNDHDHFTSSQFDVHVATTVTSSEITHESGQILISLEADGSITGNFALNEGEISGPYIINIFDEDHEIEEYADEYEIEIHIDDEEIAIIESMVEIDEKWAFTISALATGSTDLHFVVLAGEGHDHDHEHSHKEDHDHEHDEVVLYESPEIPVQID